jgi:hypothetical protein
MAGGDRPLDAGRIVGLLAEDDRRVAFAAVQLGATSLDAVVLASGLAPQAAAKALGSLGGAGLVVDGPGGLVVDGACFAAAARDALARPVSVEHADQPAEIRKVLDAFVHDGRLSGIPTQRAKRLVVLDWVVQDFAPGRRFSEADVNEVLRARHSDVAALRRHLVDEGMLDRADGMYWRAGGTVDIEPSTEPSTGLHTGPTGRPSS